MNDSRHTHPDDAELFDLATDTLDETRTAQIQHHLTHCAACSAFVASARTSTLVPAFEDAVEPLPPAADAALHARLATQWREVHDVAAETAPAPAPNVAPKPVRARRGFARWAIPAVAFAVLAALAGTSVFVVDDTTTADRARPATADPNDGAEVGAPVSSDPQVVPTPDADASADSESFDDAGAAQPDEATASTAEPADEQYEVERESVTSTPPIADQPTCVASDDRSALALPDGRPPTRLFAYPFGIVVICG